MISNADTVRKHVNDHTQRYLKENQFSFLCIGSYGLNGRISGAIGKSRAKRLLHCIESASDEGLFFLIGCVQNLESATKLKSYLSLNQLKTFIDSREVDTASSPMVDMAEQIVSWFLNVINFPAKCFKEDLNAFLSKFNVKDLMDTNSELSKELADLHNKMACRINSNCVSQRMR